jgi:hypothetical protein
MKKSITIFGLLVLLLTSCSRDYLDTDLQSTINDEQLATSPAALQVLVDGVYTSLHSYGMTSAAGHEDFGHKAIISGLDMMSTICYKQNIIGLDFIIIIKVVCKLLRDL